MKKNLKVTFEEKYHLLLKEDAEKNFRTMKATIEMIVKNYLDHQSKITD